MRYRLLIILIFNTLLLLQACKEPQVSSTEAVLLSGYDVSVQTPAGSFENLDLKNSLVPPFNIAQIRGLKDVQIIVISESLKEGRSLKVFPVGLLKITSAQQNIDYVIAVPSDEKLNYLGIESYGDLSLNHVVSKQMIEAWCKENSIQDTSTSIRWMSEQSAIEIISKRDQNKK